MHHKVLLSTSKCLNCMRCMLEKNRNKNKQFADEHVDKDSHVYIQIVDTH